MTEQSPVPGPQPEIKPPLPEGTGDIFRVIGERLKPEVSLEGDYEDEFEEILAMATILGTTTEERELFNAAEEEVRQERNASPDEPMPAKLGDKKLAESVRQGKRDVINHVLQEMSDTDAEGKPKTPNYKPLVRLAAGWNALPVEGGKTSGALDDTIGALVAELQKMPNLFAESASSQADQQQQLLTLLGNAFGGSGEGGVAFGSPLQGQSQGNRAIEDARRMVTAFFRDTREPIEAELAQLEGIDKRSREQNARYRELKQYRQALEALHPHDLVIGEGFDFSHLQPEEMLPQEVREHLKLFKRVRGWEFGIDMITQVGTFVQAARIVQGMLENQGLDLPDYMAALPQALAHVPGWAGIVRSQTEKAVGEVIARAPNPVDLGAIDLMMQRPLLVEARDPRTGRSVYVEVPHSVVRLRDVVTGFDKEQLREEAPWFISPSYNRGRAFTLEQLILDKRLNHTARALVLASAEQRSGPEARIELRHPDFRVPNEEGDGFKDTFTLKELFSAEGMDWETAGRILNQASGRLLGDGWSAYRGDGGGKVNAALLILRDKSYEERKSIVESGQIKGAGVPLWKHPDVNDGQPFNLEQLTPEEKVQLLGDGQIKVFHEKQYKHPDINKGKPFYLSDLTGEQKAALMEGGGKRFKRQYRQRLEVVSTEARYSHPDYLNGSKFTWSELKTRIPDKTERQRLKREWFGDGRLEAAYSAKNNPTLLRNLGAERWMTMSSARRLLQGKGGMFLDVKSRLEDGLAKYGLTLADVVAIDTTMADNTPVTIMNNDVREQYEMVLAQGRAANDPNAEQNAREARTLYMLGETVYVRYGMFTGLALDTAEAMQLTPQWDPKQLMDHLAELWIKSFGQQQYEEKYANFPAALREVILTALKPYIAWKMKQVDAVMISLNGRPGVFSSWNNPVFADDVEPIPPTLSVDGKAADAEQKEIVEGVLYERADWRMVATNIMKKANYLRMVAAGKIKPPEVEGLDLPITAEILENPQKHPLIQYLDAMGQEYLHDYFDEYEDMSPLIYPRSGNDALAIMDAMPAEKRAAIANLDFKDLLRVLGYDNMHLTDEEYRGWLGLHKVVETRSTKHFSVSELEKLMKNLGKYPEMSAGAYNGFKHLIVQLNQALDPFFFKYAGGKPERYGNFTPDSALEALVTGTLDLTLFAGSRTQKEALEYMDGIYKIFKEEIMQQISYTDNKLWRRSANDIIQWIMKYSQENVQTVAYEYDEGEGAHGSHRKEIQIPMTPKSLAEGDLQRWALEVYGASRAYRRMNGRVVLPDNTTDLDLAAWIDKNPKFDKSLLEPVENENEMQMIMRIGRIRFEAERLGYKLPNPYVAFANQPAYVFDVRLENGTVKAEMVDDEALALYGHRGGDPVLLSMMIRRAQDDEIITKAQAETLRKRVKEMAKNDPSFWNWWKKFWNRNS